MKENEKWIVDLSDMEQMAVILGVPASTLQKLLDELLVLLPAPKVNSKLKNREKVLIFLYIMRSGASSRFMECISNYSKMTISRIMSHMTSLMLLHVVPKYIQFLSLDKWEEDSSRLIATKFENMYIYFR